MIKEIQLNGRNGPLFPDKIGNAVRTGIRLKQFDIGEQKHSFRVLPGA
jgi:hypothetical protein